MRHPLPTDWYGCVTNGITEGKQPEYRQTHRTQDTLAVRQR
jgi:hypothetical protein